MKKPVGRTIVFSEKKMGIRGGDNIPDIKYNALLELYVKDCKIRNIEAVTILGYRNAHKYFLQFAGQDLNCSAINQDLINDYMIFLAERLKPQTVNSYVFKISPVILFGISRGYIKQDIKFSHMVEQEHFKEIYTDEEIRKLLAKPKEKSFSIYRSWVIINLLLGTGIRSQELREIQIQDFDLSNAMLSLRHTKNKKPRIIPLTTTLVEIISEYLDLRNGVAEEPAFCNIYGEPLGRTTLQTSISKYNRNRGVEKTSLHLFRHTFITLSVRSGVSPLLLKRITGHKGLKELDRYYNYNSSDLVAVINDINPIEKFKQKPKIKIDMKKIRN